MPWVGMAMDRKASSRRNREGIERVAALREKLGRPLTVREEQCAFLGCMHLLPKRTQAALRSMLATRS